MFSSKFLGLFCFQVSSYVYLEVQDLGISELIKVWVTGRRLRVYLIVLNFRFPLSVTRSFQNFRNLDYQDWSYLFIGSNFSQVCGVT
jgi:hypothetical protein